MPCTATLFLGVDTLLMSYKIGHMSHGTLLKQKEAQNTKLNWKYHRRYCNIRAIVVTALPTTTSYPHLHADSYRLSQSAKLLMLFACNNHGPEMSRTKGFTRTTKQKTLLYYHSDAPCLLR